VHVAAIAVTPASAASVASAAAAITTAATAISATTLAPPTTGPAAALVVHVFDRRDLRAVDAIVEGFDAAVVHGFLALSAKGGSLRVVAVVDRDDSAE
jgi:hypothetical protein